MSKVAEKIARYYSLNEEYTKFKNLFTRLDFGGRSASDILKAKPYWLKAYQAWDGNPFDFLSIINDEDVESITNIFEKLADATYNKREFQEKLTPYRTAFMEYLEFLEKEIDKCRNSVDKYFSQFLSCLDDFPSLKFLGSVLSLPEARIEFLNFLFSEQYVYFDEDEENENQEDEAENDAE